MLQALLHIRRRISNQATNVHPYVANCFGEKLHLDQNEKLSMFGAVHVISVDGYSRTICGLITIPRKNLPVLQSTSCNNHRVERIWVEINQRINYPITNYQHYNPTHKKVYSVITEIASISVSLPLV